MTYVNDSEREISKFVFSDSEVDASLVKENILPHYSAYGS